MADENIERWAAMAHDVYLDTARRLGWHIRPEVDVPYAELAEEAKELDRALARCFMSRVLRVLQAADRLAEAGQRLRDCSKAYTCTDTDCPVPACAAVQAWAEAMAAYEAARGEVAGDA